MECLHQICRDCTDKSMRLGWSTACAALWTSGGPPLPPLCSSDAVSEERLGQLIQKLKKDGVNPKQWRLGNFQRMLCPQIVELSSDKKRTITYTNGRLSAIASHAGQDQQLGGSSLGEPDSTHCGDIRPGEDRDLDFVCFTSFFEIDLHVLCLVGLQVRMHTIRTAH